MENKLGKSAGIALIIGSLLVAFTMFLHPAGGNVSHILKASEMLKLTHSMAVISLSIIAFGFFGLSEKLKDKYYLSYLAFAFILFSLFAIMLAAVLDGLTLPLFLTRNADTAENNLTALKPVIDFIFTLNKSLTNVFILLFNVAVLIYSILISRQESFIKWVGYLGVLLVALIFIGLLSNFTFTSLYGFRIYSILIVNWLILGGFLMIKTTNQHEG